MEERIVAAWEEVEGANEGELVPAEVQSAGGRDLDYGGDGSTNGAIVPLPETPPARVENATDAETAEWDHTMHLAQFAEASGLYPNETGLDLAMKALVGKALGLSAATSFQALKKIRDGINIPAELQRALAHRAGYRIRQVELTYEVCTLQLVVAARPGEVVGETTYTLEDAKTAKLLGNEVWHKYRKSMLFARATTDLISRFAPEVLYWSYGDTL